MERRDREPDFEDAKVRMWMESPPSGKPSEDPTVLKVNVDGGEEPYESRVYRPKHDDESIARLLEVLTGSEVGRPLPLIGAAVVAPQFLEDGVVKLLSKRTKGSGEIGLLVVASTMGRRFLLHPEQTFTEEGYRQKVGDFETRWVEQGPLALGQVIGPDEWARYRGADLSS